MFAATRLWRLVRCHSLCARSRGPPVSRVRDAVLQEPDWVSALEDQGSHDSSEARTHVGIRARLTARVFDEQRRSSCAAVDPGQCPDVRMSTFQPICHLLDRLLGRPGQQMTSEIGDVRTAIAQGPLPR